MKVLFFFLSTTLLISCFVDKPPEIEHDIYITSFDTHYDANGDYFIKDTTEAIWFTKDFWNYFIRTHPKASSMIFISPLYDTSNHNSSLKDTSYAFYSIAHINSFYFERLLADSVTGHEKENPFGFTFFITPNDTASGAAKEKRIESNLRDYKVTPTVESEFKRFKNILTWQDTAKHYVIVFKKNFANNIFKLYE